MEGRAGRAVGAAGHLSGVQFQSPDLLGPTSPALQLLLAVTQRLRIDLGLLGMRREKGAVRNRAGSRAARLPLAPAAGLQPGPAAPSGFASPRTKRGFRGPHPHPPAAARGEASPLLRIAPAPTRPGRAPGRGEGQTGGGSSPGPAKRSEAHPARRAGYFLRVFLHRFVITVIIVVVVTTLGKKASARPGEFRGFFPPAPGFFPPAPGPRGAGTRVPIRLLPSPFSSCSPCRPPS